jgi:hypothetical protein
MLDRLAKNWVYGGSLAGVLLLLLAPLLLRGWGAADTATLLCLPVYMLHQLEEHDRDRFRQFINSKLGGGADVLTTRVVFLVNIPGVWGVIALSLWLSATVNTGFGLIAAYLVLVNAVVHIMPALVMRCYNPGLVTAILLFLPLGAYCLYATAQTGAGTIGMHVTGIAIAIAIHVALIAYVLRVRRGLQRKAPALG